MIANILNLLIGLGVTDVAVFGLPAGAPAWILAPVGVIIAVLALLARRSDYSGWQSSTNTVLGLILCADTLLEQFLTSWPLVTFWIELWVGLTVACLALWATLYHPPKGAPQTVH